VPLSIDINVPTAAVHVVELRSMYWPHPVVQTLAQSGSWASTASETVPPGAIVGGVAVKLSTTGGVEAAAKVGIKARNKEKTTGKRRFSWGILPR
jgi:hypothetical protein